MFNQPCFYSSTFINTIKSLNKNEYYTHTRYIGEPQLHLIVEGLYVIRELTLYCEVYCFR